MQKREGPEVRLGTPDLLDFASLTPTVASTPTSLGRFEEAPLPWMALPAALPAVTALYREVGFARSLLAYELAEAA